MKNYLLQHILFFGLGFLFPTTGAQAQALGYSKNKY